MCCCKSGSDLRLMCARALGRTASEPVLQYSSYGLNLDRGSSCPVPPVKQSEGDMLRPGVWEDVHYALRKKAM